MAYSYKSSISFGLVYIPVELHNTVRRNEITFNQIDKKTMSRVKYVKTCVDCDDREVRQEDIVKGYEYEKNKYVIFTEEDFEKIKSTKDKNITIEQFVDINEIDPLYFDKPFYVTPTGGDSAFALLLAAMEQENKAGIAKTVLGNKETLIAIRAKDGEMLLNTLFFYEEVRKNPLAKADKDIKEAELKMAKSVISAMTAPFEPQKYRDEYREKLQEAIDRKIAGKEVLSPKEKKAATAASLMDALKASLEQVAKGNGRKEREGSKKTETKAHKTDLKENERKKTSKS